MQQVYLTESGQVANQKEMVEVRPSPPPHTHTHTCTHTQELLAHHEGMCTELESQLHECQVHTDALSHTVMELGEANEALRAENTELQTQLMNQRATEEKKKDKPPLSRWGKGGEGGRGQGVQAK